MEHLKPWPKDTDPVTTKVQIGEYGKRIGESHGRAKLTDHEIELIRQLREGGMPCAEIARKFEINRRYVYKLCSFERRGCAPVKTVWRKNRSLPIERK